MSSATEIDLLVIGSGPAGAALGAFLGQNGEMGAFRDIIKSVDVANSHWKA